MENALRPILELSVAIPALFLAYTPMKSYLRKPAGKLIRWVLPLLLAIIIGCARRRRSRRSLSPPPLRSSMFDRFAFHCGNP